jgi:glycosyltransferase involved in cell wall biosynthesis
VFRLFDGIVVISTFLEEYVRPRMRPGAWVMRVPILVDVADYDAAAAAVPGLAGFAGSLGHHAEIDAFVSGVAAVARRHPEARGRIMAPGTPEDLARLQDSVRAAGAEDRIDAAGAVPAADMPAALCSCSALALPRAEGVFSNAGMPTKLGEYLATGRPVVVTATGDIPRYLDDGVNAFVVPPGDQEAFETGLEQALFDPAAASVGKAGQRVARSAFDSTAQMRRLLAAIERDIYGTAADGRPDRRVDSRD